MPSRFEVLLSGSAGGGVDAWDVDTGANLLSHTNPKLHPTSTSVCHSHSSSGRHALHLPDPAKPYVHQLAFSLSHTSQSSISTSTSSSLPSSFSALSLSPSSLYLAASSSSSPTVFLFSRLTGALLSSYSTHYKGVCALLFSPDERFLLSGGDDGCVNATAVTDALRDDDLQRPLRALLPPSLLSPSPAPGTGAGVRAHLSFASHSLPVTALAVAAGSAHPLVFSASLDHCVHAHSLVAGQTTQRWLFPCALTALAVTSTLSALFAGGHDGTVYCQPLVRAAAGAGGDGGPGVGPVPMAGHALPVTCLALSFDCALLVSASRDASFRVWDARTLQCTRVVRRVGRASFDWCRFVRDTGEGRDWPPLRGQRRRADEALVPLTVGRAVVTAGGGKGEEGEEGRWADWMEDWRLLVGEDDRSRLARELEAERQRREAAEAEVRRWTALSTRMYRISAQLMLKERAGGGDRGMEEKGAVDDGQPAGEGEGADAAAEAAEVDEAEEVVEGVREGAEEAMEGDDEEEGGAAAKVT